MAARARDLEEALGEPQLPGAVAGRALLGSRSGPGAGAAARVARLVARDLHLGLGAERRLGEADLEVVAQVGAAAARRAAAPSAAAEDVAEDSFEDVVDVRAAEPLVERARPESARRLVPEAIVARALLRIAKNLVRLGQFLEALLGLLVALVLVGMELDRELAERALQLLRRAGALDAEDLVVVSLLRLHLLSGRRAGDPPNVKQDGDLSILTAPALDGARAARVERRCWIGSSGAPCSVENS